MKSTAQRTLEREGLVGRDGSLKRDEGNKEFRSRGVSWECPHSSRELSECNEENKGVGYEFEWLPAENVWWQIRKNLGLMSESLILSPLIHHFLHDPG